ncbi:mitochondrial genome maintenance exonuclease 1-like [Phlebotomus papatasi]|uniref:mitochondrial genome maintenance exonuclease 1-like n=1 Tax=Phlebotomus papatasi TaxID=29031 RepID=UPI002483FDE4|nr:mitochondrial genome maintenance exonuclease 1-like [Phlebotomus papatasi]
MQNFPQNTAQMVKRSIQGTLRRYFLSPKREKSTENKDKRAQTIRSLNYENKAMFGAVLRRSKKSQVSRTASEISEKSSEFFWMMQKKQKTEKITGNLTNTPSRPSLPDSLLDLQQNLPPQPKIPRKSPKPPIHNTQTIPFDSTTLKELVDIPLVFNKKHSIQKQSPHDILKLPSVGRVLQATMPEASREALMRWKVLKIAELGEEGFRKLNERHLSEGARLHGWIEEFFSTGKSPEDAEFEGGWKSVQGFLGKVQPKIVEAKISHPFLKYHGIVDCVSLVDSELHVIEWKKSERMKPNLADTFDAPLQLAAYLGAVNATLPAHGLTTPVLRGAVVVIYTDGTPAHVHLLGNSDVRFYWRAWLLRLQEFWVRSRDGTLPEPI